MAKRRLFIFSKDTKRMYQDIIDTSHIESHIQRNFPELKGTNYVWCAVRYDTNTLTPNEPNHEYDMISSLMDYILELKGIVLKE